MDTKDDNNDSRKSSDEKINNDILNSIQNTQTDIKW